jgi:hypothetical protein
VKQRYKVELVGSHTKTGTRSGRIAGKRAGNKEFYVFEVSNDWYGEIRTYNLAKRVGGFKVSDIDPQFRSIELPFKCPWNKYVSTIDLNFDSVEEAQSQKGSGELEPDAIRYLSFRFVVPLKRWANPYSITDYIEAIHNAVHKYNEDVAFFEKAGFEDFLSSEDEQGNPTVEFGIAFVIISDDVIRDHIGYWGKKVQTITELAATNMLKVVRKDSLINYFEFPAPLRVACGQYLLYFVQFLEDLGIGVDAEIKEDVGKVLFSVTPKDGPAALGKIKEALEVYLDFPRNPGFSAAAGQFVDPSVVQLKANVLFLQSQLALAQAVLETKNATIEALNFTLFQDRQLITGPSTGQSKQESASEPVLGDTVHLTEYKGKFLKIDLPTILRRLKRSFGIGHKKED